MRSSSDVVRPRDVEDVASECERLLVEHDALELCVSMEPRRREDQHADLRLLFSDRRWLQSDAGRALIAELEGQAMVASVERHRSAVLLRFDDAVLARLEHRLAAGEPAGMNAAHLLEGRRFTVGFVGPNTNKALHVGHLRNVLLGQALSCALAAAGASVQRHNLVGDIGRRVCEAMCGYLARHSDEDPVSAGIVGDRFVELCSRDFPGSDRAATDERGSDPNAEENEACGDVADEIMAAWLQGAPAERALWSRMREWALTGHRSTLARLGVEMDRQDFESEGVPRALELIAGGLERGLFEREASGAVVYRTGRPEYTTMVLLRADGAPTEYARLLGVYHRMHEALEPGALYVEVVGIEWQPPMAVLGELLGRLLAIRSEERYTWEFHGWVTVEGQKMGSSTGEVMWIDDLLDEVAAGSGVAELHELAGGVLDRQQLADAIVRGSFLCSATLQPLAFARKRLRDGGAGPGRTIAEAWCRAERAGAAGSSDRAPVARTAVVQSQLYRRALARASDKRDAATLASYLLGLAEACLTAPAPGPAAAPILRRAMSSLGFLVGNQEPSRLRESAIHEVDHPRSSRTEAAVGDNGSSSGAEREIAGRPRLD